MPMIDAFIPAGAMTEEAERTLIREVTDLVVEQEIGDRDHPAGQQASWVFLHRPLVSVAGAPATSARYRFIVSLPEGQFDEARREAVVQGITEAISRAEGRALEEVRNRVWVLALEVPDGSWGSRGSVVRLPDILGFLLGGGGREAALERMAQRRGW